MKKVLIHSVKGFNVYDEKQHYIESLMTMLRRKLKQKGLHSTWEDDNDTIYLSVLDSNYKTYGVDTSPLYSIDKHSLLYNEENINEDVDKILNEVVNI